MNAGAIAALCSAALFGASVPLAKLLVGDMHPLLLAGLLYVGSGIGLSVFIAARSAISKVDLRWPDRRDFPWLAGAYLSGGVFAPVLLMLGLSSLGAAQASLLLNLESVFTALLAWFVFRENFDRRIALGMTLIVAGALLLAGQGDATQGVSYGAILVIAACALWGLDNNLMRKASAADASIIGCLKGWVAGSVNVSLALALGLRLPPWQLLVETSLVGFAGYGASVALFVVGLRHLGTARTSAYFSVAPFFGAALAVPLHGEPLTAKLMIAGLLMAAGVWLHLSEVHAHPHEHEAIIHHHQHVHDAEHSHEHDFAWRDEEPHDHVHSHVQTAHTHAHYPDIDHRHPH